MDVRQEVLYALDEVLSLGGRARLFTPDTLLLGAIPELDSMAVVSLLTSLQERLGVNFRDDDFDGGSFRTVGSLVALVDGRLARP